MIIIKCQGFALRGLNVVNLCFSGENVKTKMTRGVPLGKNSDNYEMLEV